MKEAVIEMHSESDHMKYNLCKLFNQLKKIFLFPADPILQIIQVLQEKQNVQTSLYTF